MTREKNSDEIRESVRERYGEVARSCGGGCCEASASCCCESVEAMTHAEALGYSAEEIGSVPADANMGLGCGNPQAIAALQPGAGGVTPQAEFADAFDVLIGDCQGGPKQRILGRYRHETTLPRQEGIGLPIVGSTMAHATLLHLDKFNVGLFRLHPGQEYLGTHTLC